MSTQYDEMQGDEMDAKSHPANNVPTATQHFAGDVVAMPMGMGTMARAIMGNISNSLPDYSKPTDKTNVVPMPIKKPK